MVRNRLELSLAIGSISVPVALVVIAVGLSPRVHDSNHPAGRSAEHAAPKSQNHIATPETARATP
jgi:hypothetical protein